MKSIRFATILFIIFYLPFVLFSQNEEIPVFYEVGTYDSTDIQKFTLKEGVIKIRKGNNWGYEVNGVIKIPIIYDDLGAYDSLYISATKKENEKTHAGIISSQNETIIPFDYFKTIVNVGYNTFTVYDDKGWGIIGLNNKPIVNFIHTFCQTIKLSKYPNVNYACYDFRPSRLVLYDSVGTLIKSLPNFQSIKEIDEKHYLVQGTDLRYGVIDSKFKVIIKPIYHGFRWSHDNLMCFYLNKNEDVFSQIVNIKTGKLILEKPGMFSKPNSENIIFREYFEGGNVISESYDLDSLTKK